MVNESLVIPRFNTLTIKGVLEFVSGYDYRLEANQIIIKCGQLIAGWENEPMLSKLDIVLGVNTKLQTSDFIEKKVGHKGIGVFGYLDLHGKPREVVWTYLNETADRGSEIISLVDPVDWQVGEEIVITTTSFSAEQTEVKRIVDISEDNMTLTLNTSLEHAHLSFSESFYGTNKDYMIRAAVGLLSRNIRISGREESSDIAQLYGTRMLVWGYGERDGHVITIHRGEARLSNVEMRRPGHYNVDENNLKYGILFWNQHGASYVMDCSFYLGLGSAIGLIDSTCRCY